MKLPLWQVDAFAARVFSGNPAAVVPLEEWLPDQILQAIARENNLSETAFFVARAADRGGQAHYDLRWFTPVVEVPLCGHATLASGWVVLNILSPSSSAVHFHTRSGTLTVARGGNGLFIMSLPADDTAPFTAPDGFGAALGAALGVCAPDEIHSGRYLMAVWKDARIIRAIVLGDITAPMRASGHWGLIATAGGETAAPYDVVSRFFSIDHGIPEDPVTGSAHAMLTPFWAKRLGKRVLRAHQASARGGDILCTDDDERVSLAGDCALYLSGAIEI